MHEGSLIRGQAIWYSHAASILIMETIAVREGIKLAYDLGLSPSLVLRSKRSE
jgi:hypothetical protein